MLINNPLSIKSNEKKKSCFLSPNKIKRREIVALIEKKWTDSNFIISYNFYELENRNIEILKLELKEKFNSDFISFGVFKNNLIKKLMQKFFNFNKNYNDIKVSGNSFLFFVSGNIDIFDFLSTFRKIDEKFFSEVYKKNTSSNEFLEFNDRLNWAFIDNKFKNSNELFAWSKIPSKNVLLNNLVSFLLSNLITLILCFEKIHQG